MPLSSSQLEAFAEVAKTGSFSQAAKNLHITQSALSQRVLNLEKDLATSLIIRDPNGLRLTPIGDELLRYFQIKNSLEQEVVGRIAERQAALTGVVRIAGFSSVMRSVVMPSISALLTKNPTLTVELFSREVRDLAAMLASNETDFTVTTIKSEREEIECHYLGKEENVLIEPANAGRCRDTYLDHDQDDATTAAFFRLQKKAPKTIRREYVDEVYAIIDAVAAGWGRGVVPKHLITTNRRVAVVKGLRSLDVSVFLSFYRQAHHSQLQRTLIDLLVTTIPQRLAP